MKKIITLLMLTLIVSISFAQYTPMTAAGYQFKRILCDSTLHIPSFCGIPTLRNSTAKNGAIAMDTCNYKIYMWTNAVGWGEIIGAGTDTTSLSNRIDQRVKYTDTAAMLSKYLRIIDTANKFVANVTKINDSTIRVFKGGTITDLKILGKGTDTSSLSTRIDARVKYTDTAAMLLPYLRKTDTTAMLSKYLRKTDTASLSNRINLKVNISDTATMLSKYLRKTDTASLSNRINLKVNISDTATMLSKYLRKTDTASLSNRINLKLNIADTINKWVSNVTKKNDSTITIFKGTSATDIILPRGSGGSGTTPSLQDVTTVGATTSDKITMSQPLTGLTNEFNAVTGTRISIINSFIESVGHIELNYLSDYNTEFFNPSLVMAGEGAHPTTNIILRTDEILLQNPVKGIVSLKMQDTTEQPNLYFPRGDTQIDTLATLRDLRSGGSSGTVTNVATGYGLSGGPITNTGTLTADTSDSGLSGKYLRITDTTGKWASASGYVPYVGATTDLDMGVHQVNAQSFYANGSNGNGHIHLKHQNSDATGQGQTTTIFADANGDFKWKNAGNFYTTLKTSGNAANAIYTFPSATTTLIGAGDTATMLTPYLRSNIAAATYLAKTDTASLSSRINLKVNIADTSSMLTPYIRLAGTGLTKSSQTLSNNLSTGVSGGQSVVGGTAASESLTLSSTTNATKGNLIFGTSRYFENNNRLGINTSTDAGYTLDVNGTARIQNALTITTNGINITGNSSGNRFRLGNATAYRTTNAGTALTPISILSPNAGSDGSISAGALGWVFDDNESTGLSFLAGNGTNHVARAGITIASLTNTAGSESGDMIFLTQSGGTAMSEKMRITGAGGLTINATNTASGTTGNQTINKPSGTVNIAAAGTTVTVTNSLVTASSIVYAVIRTNDATATIKNVVPAAGSFVINLGAAATAEVSIGFFVIN